MAQPIGTEVKIRAGETAESGRLAITYIGLLNEEKRAAKLGLDINNASSYFFEVKDYGKISKHKSKDKFTVNDLIIEIIKEKSDSSVATVIVMNEKMAKRSLENDVNKSIESYEKAKMAFEKLANLMGEPAPDSVVASLSAYNEIMYFTFANANPDSVSLNGIELSALFGAYRIEPGLLKKANFLMLYYRGECYKCDFTIASGNEQRSQSFIVPKVMGE